MNLIYHWLSGSTHTQLCIIGQHSPNTITAFMKYFRQVAAQDIIEEKTIIGGPNIIVEIDESKFAKRKCNRGHTVNGVWVVGGVERSEERKLFSVTVESRDSSTLKSVIKQYVLPGSIIYTDCWKGYDWIDTDPDYMHRTVNHSLGFKDETTQAHTNSIEGTWAGMKRTMPYKSRSKANIEEAILSFIWKRQNESRLWEAFMDALADYVELEEAENLESER